jgi:hypothetical protein
MQQNLNSREVIFVLWGLRFKQTLWSRVFLGRFIVAQIVNKFKVRRVRHGAYGSPPHVRILNKTNKVQIMYLNFSQYYTFIYTQSISSVLKKLIYPCNRSSRLLHFPDNRFTDGGEVASFMRRPASTPQEGSWYSFLSEAEPTPGS